MTKPQWEQRQKYRVDELKLASVENCLRHIHIPRLVDNLYSNCRVFGPYEYGRIRHNDTNAPLECDHYNDSIEMVGRSNS
jgi:hypothetical protein